MALISETAIAMMSQILIWAQILLVALIIYYIVKWFTLEKKEPEGLHTASPGALKHTAGFISDFAGTLFGQKAKDALNMTVWGATTKENIHKIDSEFNVLSSRFQTLDETDVKSLIESVNKLVGKTLNLKKDELNKTTDLTIKSIIKEQTIDLGVIETLLSNNGTCLSKQFLADYFTKKEERKITDKDKKAVNTRLVSIITRIENLLKKEQEIEKALEAKTL